MTYIALPHGFSKTEKAPKTYMIARMEEDHQRPVGFMEDLESPVPLQQLAENFASSLNGSDPLHSFDHEFEMFYEQHAQGFTLRCREQGQTAGVTSPCARFTTIGREEFEIV